jgi:periplasmic divalent cation tolerance protein
MTTGVMTTDASTRISEIRTTVGDRAAAEGIARRLVGDRLAACVQIDAGVESVYRWKDAVEQSVEWRLTVKTSLGRTAECVASLVEQHAYEIPEVLVSEFFASPAYAEWVLRSTSP